MNWDSFRKDLDVALSSVTEKYNVSLSPKTIRYNDLTFRFTVEGAFLQDDKSAEQVLFESHCTKFNVSPDMYGAILNVNNEEMKLIGLNPKARKYPVIVEDKDGVQRKAGLSILRKRIR